MKFCCVLLMLPMSFFFNAQTNVWTGSVDSDWHKDCNWSLSSIPTSSDVVEVPIVGIYPIITGNAHCRELNITSTNVNAVTLNSSGGGTLCISSTNGGVCSTSLTDNSGGCPSTPSTAWSGNGTMLTYGLGCGPPSPFPTSRTRSLTNNTSFPISFSWNFDNSRGGHCSVTPLGITVVTINPGETLGITFSGCLCWTEGIHVINWTSSDGGSGMFRIFIAWDNACPTC